MTWGLKITQRRDQVKLSLFSRTRQRLEEKIIMNCEGVRRDKKECFHRCSCALLCELVRFNVKKVRRCRFGRLLMMTDKCKKLNTVVLKESNEWGIQLLYNIPKVLDS